MNDVFIATDGQFRRSKRSGEYNGGYRPTQNGYEGGIAKRMRFEELHNFAWNGPFIGISGRTFDVKSFERVRDGWMLAVIKFDAHCGSTGCGGIDDARSK